MKTSIPHQFAVVVLVLGFALTPYAASASDLNVSPSPLLSIDQNRTTVVDRVVAQWGDALANSGAGLSKEQLQTLLTGLRSDQLLAASLAGSLDGLRNVIATAMLVSGPVARGLIETKALGDAADDLVYTPVVPCRILDTRTAGGFFGTGETRSYHAYLTSGTFATQGGAASNCAIPANPGAVALNIAVVSTTASGFLTAWQFGAAQPTASTINYAPGQIIANGAIVPTCQPSCASEFSVNASGVQVIIDIVGYFRAPSPIIAAGGITNAMLANGSVGLTKLDTATVDTRYAVKSFIGTQVSNTLTAGATQYWFTFGYPTTTRFIWRAVPTTVGGKVELVSQEIELSGTGTYTYWLLVQNTGSITSNYDLQRFGLD